MILGGASGPPPRPAACLVNIALNWISFADQKNSRQNSHKLSAPKGAVLRPNTAPLGCLGGGAFLVGRPLFACENKIIMF